MFESLLNFTRIRKSLVVILILNLFLVPIMLNAGKTSASSSSNFESQYASTNNNNQCSTDNILDIQEVDEETAQSLLKIALASDEFDVFEQEPHHFEFTFDIVKHYAFKIGDLYTLYIPIAGATNDSFLGIQFDGSFSIVRTMAALLRPDTEGNILFHFRIDGQTIADLVITEEGKVKSGLVFDLEGNELDLQNLLDFTIGDWWNCMNSCLSFNGVPLYLITGLSIVCGAVCVMTAGLACGICISAALGAYSGVGALCLGACADGQW